MDAVVATLPVAVLLAGADGRVVEANAAAIAILGPIRTGVMLTTHLRAPAAVAAIETAMAGLIARAEMTLRRQGRDHALEIHARPMPQGGILVLLRDIAAEALVTRQRAEFVADASHELRSPLTALSGLAEALADTDEDAARAGFLSDLQREIGRMTRIVEDLMALSVAERHEDRHDGRETDIGTVLTEVARSLAPLAAKRGITVTMPDCDHLTRVAGGAELHFQITRNLLENALLYGLQDGAVRIEATEGRDGMLALGFVDDGAGIAAHHLPRLTERFYRADAARARDTGGSGLGLAIVKHVLSRIGGTLAIESTPGVGSRFTVRLPIAPADG